jgi:protocatechuate 3,4-dioxygenase alpha subunit
MRRPPDDLAPHLTMLVFMRGLLKPVLTRILQVIRETQPFVIALVPADRRAASFHSGVDATFSARWNIVLQGAGETVFFEW